MGNTKAAQSRPDHSAKFDLSGRSVVLTGGGAGLGRATALTLAAHGARIGILDRVAERVDAVVAEVEALGGSAIGIPLDITDEAAVDAAVTRLAAAFSRLDVLVNCAGIFDELRPAASVPTALWDRVIAVNLTGSFFMTRAVLPHMVAAGAGSIVNIASEAGLRGGCGGAAYVVSKHGLVGLTRTVAWGYRQDGIRCNAVCPGGIGGTEIITGSSYDEAYSERCYPVMSLAGEPGVPQSIADAVLFLASDQSAFINGAILPVDGGWSAG